MKILQENLPHTPGPLEALPPSAVSEELPTVEGFLAPAVTGGWNQVPGMSGAVNFAGEPIVTAPDIGLEDRLHPAGASRAAAGPAPGAPSSPSLHRLPHP